MPEDGTGKMKQRLGCRKPHLSPVERALQEIGERYRGTKESLMKGRLEGYGQG